ncbi:hypothetical protein MHYP_G00087250 [Metynnis hypsauchen]
MSTLKEKLIKALCPQLNEARFLIKDYMINEKFRRITTVSLEQRFMDKLDHYSPELVALMKAEGGVVGTKLRPHLDKLCQLIIMFSDSWRLQGKSNDEAIGTDLETPSALENKAPPFSERPLCSQRLPPAA